MTTKLLLTATGAVAGLARDDPGWVVPPGGRVIDVPLTFADLDTAEQARATAPQPAELAYDTTKRALVARARALSGDEAARKAARDTILVTAQGAVGKAVATLTTAERNALLTVLLWGAGAVRPDLTVAPLAEWARATPRDG